MRRTGVGPRRMALMVLLALGVAVEAAAQGPAVGGWATYEWRSAAKVDVPVLSCDRSFKQDLFGNAPEHPDGRV